MGRPRKHHIEDDVAISEAHHLSSETKHAVIGILLMTIALFFILAWFGAAGFVGMKVYAFFHYLIGVAYFILPLTFVIASLSYLMALKRAMHFVQMAGIFLFALASLGLIDIISKHSAGVIGKLLTMHALSFFDTALSIIIFAVLAIIALLITLNTSITSGWFLSLIKLPWRLIKSLLFKAKVDEMNITSGNEEDAGNEEPTEEEGEKEETEKTTAEEKPAKVKIAKTLEKDEAADISIEERLAPLKPYNPPPLSLVARDKGKPGVGDIKANANIIKRTLQNFGITVEMDEVSIGPSVTRYALKPAEGVKLARIVALQNDLSLALAAHPIRIEAPIPGKSLVGIEIPNTTKTTVGLSNLLGHKDFVSSEKPLLVALGRGVSGISHFSNIAKMPHLLIAGATGSGKSVTVHALITSLLYRNSPENLRFIMVDPKRVELTLYNKIPHLLTPVIKDAKKAILALRWAAKEMERRYNLLESQSVRDVDSYHKNILAPELKKIEKLIEAGEEITTLPDRLPYIVIVIDELADIMQAYPRELEAAIVRLAQMSRAVGIHLIISTQRPSVNVITGLIKANVPSRIALQVASQIDSRTILDTSGAEKLLGAGDMLYLSGDMSKPVRIQSAYISEEEVKAVVDFIARQYADEVPNELDLNGPMTDNDHGNAIFGSELGGDGGDEDDLYEDARQVVIEAGKASTSYIQRKLRVGYSRAARLMDILEERGVIGPADGSKPREVISHSEGYAPEEDKPTQQ